jgi:isopenicillin N synthase-like dioxygenase
MEYFHHSFGVRLPKGLSNKTDDLFNQLLGLGLELLSWLESELPADIVSNFKGASLKDMVALTTVETVMRFIHYPFVEKIDSSQEVNRAHEDINFLTLLTSATGHGLQVKDLSGNWHDVGYEQDDIIVNAGDMLQMLTQGFYKSTTHRVIINPSHKRARYSMPLFIGPKGDTLLSKDLTAREYFLQRMEENGIKQISDTH